MKYLHITARLLAPIIVQQSRQSNAPKGLPFLPGSTLRGALAAKLIRAGRGPDHEDFRSIFIDDPIYFSDLLPTNEEMTPSQVLPLSSISCKLSPGFIGEKSHGVKDTLAIAAVSRKRRKPVDDSYLSCRFCKNDMKPQSEFWNGDLNNPQKFQSTMLYQRHTGIDRATGAIASSIFFMTQAIADYRKSETTKEFHQQYLCGGIYVTEKQHETIRPLIEGALFVGADRTRGMGEIELFVREKTPPGRDLEEWNNGFKGKLKSIMADDMESDAMSEMMSGTYFSIKLESHAILVDQFLRPTPELELPFKQIDQIECIAKIAKSQLIRGWQSAWRIPKPDDMGLSMGSVFLFKYTGKDDEKLKSFLEDLAVKGIGLRREEGFGRVLICDPLHTKMEVI